MHVVRGALKDYDWGVVDGLARWHGEPTGRPQAELWFGTHPSGPATVARGIDAGRPLSDFPEHDGMPMVKLLAASTPLSIQVHPDRARARRGWQDQQTSDAEPGLYADDAEKSEMLCAIAAFDAHAGWRDARSAADVLTRSGAPEAVVSAVLRGDPATAARLLLEMSPEECAPVERRLVASATAAGWTEDAVSALARVAATHPADPGVLVTVLLDHVLLAPGEALAMPAGVVHSYVYGLGVEVMTSSDNVLRLGLTPKRIALEEAIDAIRPDRVPAVLGGYAGDWLRPPGMPFALALAEQTLPLDAGQHRIVLALQGEVEVAAGPDVAVLAEGEAAILAPGEPAASAEPQGMAIAVLGDQPPG